MPEVEYDEMKQRAAKVKAGGGDPDAFLADAKKAGFTWKVPSELERSGKAIEGTSDVGIKSMGASETIHDLAGALPKAIGAAAAPVEGEGALKGAAKKVVRGVAGAADLGQSLIPMGPEDLAMGPIAEEIAAPVAKGVGKVAGKVWGAVKPQVTPMISPIAERGILAARELGIPLTYAEFAQSKTAAQMESLAKKIPFLSDVMARADRAKTAVLNDARTNLLKGLGESPEPQALGAQARPALAERLSNIEKAREQRYGALRSEAAGGLNAPALPEQRTAAVLASKAGRDEAMTTHRGVLYDRAEGSLPDPAARVATPSLKGAAGGVAASYGETGSKTLRGKAYSVAKDYLKEAPAGAAGGMDSALAKRLAANPEALARQSPEIQKAVAAAAGSDVGSMTPAELRAEISNLGDAAEAARRPDGSYSKDGKHILDIRRGAKADLDAFYKTQAPETQRAYALADAFHGGYSDRMRNATIARLYKEAPSQTFESIVKSGDADLTGKLAAALGPDGKNVLKRQLFDNVFGTGKEIPDSKTVIKNLSDYGPGVRAIFKPAEVDALKRFALTGETPPFIQSEFERTARALVKQNPEELSKSILGGNVEIARAAKKYLPPATFKAYGRQLAENILASSPDPEVGFKAIQGRFAAKEEVLKEFFDKRTIDGMRKIGEASQILPGYGDLAYRPPSAAGSAVAMGMWGVILHPGKLVGGVGVSLFGGHQLAELYTSDTGRKWITTVMRMSADDPRVPALAARGVQLAAHSLAIQPSVQKKAAEAVGIK